MSATICPGADLLLCLRHDLLEDPAEVARLRVHLAGCAACAASVAALEQALLPPPDPEPPAAVLRAVEERIAAEEVARAGHEEPTPPPLDVRLRCTWCHDGLVSAGAVYCAACLAPHHEECFAEDGRCAAPGCGGRAVLRREPSRSGPGAERAASPPRRRRLVRGLAALVAGGALSAVALLPVEEPGPSRPTSPAPPEAPAPAPLPPAPAPPAPVESAPAGPLGRPLRAGEAEARAILAQAGASWATARGEALAGLGDDLVRLRDLAVSRPDPRPALAQLERALELDPGLIEARLLQARVLRECGDRAGAKAVLSRAADEARDQVQAVLARAARAELDGAWAEAAMGWAEAARLDPTLALASEGQARACLELRRDDQARAAALRALSRDRGSAEALTLELEARWRLGELDAGAARVELGTPLRLDPAHPRALALLARARLRLDPAGRAQEQAARELAAAELDAARALRADPAEWRAELALAQVAEARGQWSAALAPVTRAVERGNHPEAWLVRGRLRLRDGDQDLARRDLERAAELTRGRASDAGLRARALGPLARCELTRRELSAAWRYLEEALAIDPQEAELWALRGLVRYRQYEARRQRKAELTGALDDLTRAIELDARLAEPLFYRALVCLDLARHDQALVDLGRYELLVRDDLVLGSLGARQLPLVDFYRALAYKGRGEASLAVRVLTGFLAQVPPGHPLAAEARACLRELEPTAAPGGPAAGTGSLHVVVALENFPAGAELRAESASVPLPDGAAVRVSLATETGGRSPVQLVFSKALVKGGRFLVERAWPEQTLPPLLYTLQVEVHAEDQAPELRRRLDAERGWTPGSRELLARRSVRVGTPEDEAPARERFREELRSTLGRLEALLPRLRALTGAGPEEAQLLLDLRALHEELRRRTQPLVTTPLPECLEQVQQALSAAARAVQAGDPQAGDRQQELARAAEAIAAARSAVDARPAPVRPPGK